VLRARDITLIRSGRTVLNGVSFDVRPGEIVALIGANGAGKTSLLESIVGFHRLASGGVSWNERGLRTLSDRAAVFSYMADDAQPPAEVSVQTLLAHAQQFGGGTTALVDQLTERLALRALLAARGGELSRGERRRVALFGALCTTRPVVVLDEPLGVFDPLQLIDVLALLRERAKGGTAMLLSIHQLSDAEKIADRVLVLHEGRALGELGPPEGSLEDAFLKLLKERHARA
jgi:ABC-type multidrug transport system ATPase subunit